MEPQSQTPLDAYGAATVELLRVDARRRVYSGVDRRGPWGSARRVVVRVFALTLVQLLASAAGLDLLKLLDVYAALVGIGVLPAMQRPNDE